MADRAPANRLRLSHLLVWMAVTGVLYGLLAQQLQSERQAIEDNRNELALSAADYANFQRFSANLAVLRSTIIPFEAVAVASLFILPWRRTQLPAGFPTQPGHWLLLAAGCGFVANFLCREIVWLVLDPLVTNSEEFTWTMIRVDALYGIMELALPATGAAILTLGLWQRSDDGLWIVVFRVLIAALVLICIGYILRATVGYPVVTALWAFIRSGYILFFAGFALACIGGAHDLWRRAPRDWFHYAGIVVLGTAIVERFGNWLIARIY